MQTLLLSSSLRSISIGKPTRFPTRTSLLSSAFCYTVRSHRHPASLSEVWSTVYRRFSTVTPQVRLTRAFSTRREASGSSTPIPTSTSASTVHSTAEEQILPSVSSQEQQPQQSPCSHPDILPSQLSIMNGANTSPRAKRKPSPFELIESGRPSKHHRSSLNGKQSAGDNTPDIEAADLEMRDHDFLEEATLQTLPTLGPDTAEWQATIENVVRNVVSIRFCQTCSFDTDPALNSEATGFVVDAERGYILTNRHVVGSGPFWGYCIFDNHEEVDAYPVYRDPVHDFGILKFDPKAIKYMPVKALTLRPDLAKGIFIKIFSTSAL